MLKHMILGVTLAMLHQVTMAETIEYVGEPQTLSDPSEMDSADFLDAEYMGDWIIFQEETQSTPDPTDNLVRIARMDPATGRCETIAGRSTCLQGAVVANDATTIPGCSWKGPNFGYMSDDAGNKKWAIFYNRSAGITTEECYGNRYIVRVDPGDEANLHNFNFKILTNPSKNSVNVLGSQDFNMTQIYIAYGDNDAPGGMLYKAATGEDFPKNPLARVSFRWVKGLPALVTTRRGGEDDGEIQYTAVTRDETRLVTNASNNIDGYDHLDAYGWLAPENGGALTFVSRFELDADPYPNNKLIIYRFDAAQQGFVRDKIVEIPVCATPQPCYDPSTAFDGETSDIYLQSWEPFVFNGRSYFVGTVKPEHDSSFKHWSQSEIWIIPYGEGDPIRVHPRWPGTVVHEAEFYQGSDGTDPLLFISFNKFRKVDELMYGELWRSQLTITP